MQQEFQTNQSFQVEVDQLELGGGNKFQKKQNPQSEEHSNINEIVDELFETLRKQNTNKVVQ